MKELNTFALRAANTNYPVEGSGGTHRIEIRSRREKFVNGKTTEVTTPSCTVSIAESWLNGRIEVDSEYRILNLYLTISKNESSQSRTSIVTLQQEGSNKVITLTVIQEAGISYQYFVVGKPRDGIMINDPSTLNFETHFVSTSNAIIFQVLKVGFLGSQVVSQEIIGNTSGFTAYSRPINDGFRLVQESGADETSISTKGGSSGTWYGTVNVSFTTGSGISGSNDIELYQR